jgi:hypothetical protein
MRTHDAEALWNEIVIAVRMGDVPLHCAVTWTPDRLRSAWKQLNNNLLRGVLTKLSLQTVFALELVHRVASSVAARDPDDAAYALRLIAVLEQAAGAAPGTIEHLRLRPARDQSVAIKNHHLREMVHEIAWWIEAPEAYPPHLLPISLERLAADELKTTSREVLLAFGPPTIEQIVAAAEACALERDR